MSTVRFEVYIQSLGIFGDEVELDWEETYEDEYPSRTAAEKAADKDTYGCCGEFVEVYIDDKFYRSYEVE